MQYAGFTSCTLEPAMIAQCVDLGDMGNAGLYAACTTACGENA